MRKNGIESLGRNKRMRAPNWYKIAIGKFKITYPIKIKEYNFGIYYSKNGTIGVKKNLGHTIKCHTIVHEVIHAICTTKGMFTQKEKDVETMTEAFIHFIKENPHIVKYIQSNE